MKTCRKCLFEKPLDAFYPKKTAADGRTSYCRPCHLEYMRERREDAAARRGDGMTSRQRRLALVQRNKAVVWDYLIAHPCTDCPESDPLVLQFDHVRGVKLNNISALVTGGYSLDMLLAEIAKCEVRCANCHIKVTMKRGGHAKRPTVFAHAH